MNKSVKRFIKLSAVCVSLFFGTCKSPEKEKVERPMDVWAFRSVLDKKPRMLTLALDSECYIAYDLSRCSLYKAWKGGVSMDGAAYTDKKEIQPASWGTAYWADSIENVTWLAKRDDKDVFVSIAHHAYRFKHNQISLKYNLVVDSGDTIQIEEKPEFVKNDDAKPGLERTFSVKGAPPGTIISLKSADTTLVLDNEREIRHTRYFETLPEQIKPKPKEKFIHTGRTLMNQSDCFTCHKIADDEVGPSFRKIAQRYSNDKKSMETLSLKIKEGGTGVWGSSLMNPHPSFTDLELSQMVNYIFTLKPKIPPPDTESSKRKKENIRRPTKPGFGEPLAGVHPSFDLTSLHTKDFKPRVGAMAFLPDGRLLVTTWDQVGGVYILDGVSTGDTSKIKIKRIASGLAEPLGIEVVNGEIYVVQKQELTKLIDLDGDEIIDEYQVVCSSWGVTSDFHEFAFGLVHQDDHFYITLSMAMRLKPGEKQLPDRGRTLRIASDGSFESINYGLRTPNGIGIGVDDQIFITDNQGQWLPGNKLIHVKRDEYHGMAWGWLSDSSAPEMAQPALWLPENEIGNSPSEPVLIHDGPYKGQMLHGDVTHGGIKRDFLEKINGEYQGAVFSFSQGFEAGVNRMRWGPDGALYIGEVGMKGGGWSWKEKVSGLQRLMYNGKPTFEMLAVRAIPTGFEIEFTVPLKEGIDISHTDFLIEQWWYLPTQNYGGPKMDLERLNASTFEVSDDRRKVTLQIPDLKSKRVVYLRLPDDLLSADNQSLWSSETWYTLNNIPN